MAADASSSGSKRKKGSARLSFEPNKRKDPSDWPIQSELAFYPAWYTYGGDFQDEFEVLRWDNLLYTAADSYDPRKVSQFYSGVYSVDDKQYFFHNAYTNTDMLLTNDVIALAAGLPKDRARHDQKPNSIIAALFEEVTARPLHSPPHKHFARAKHFSGNQYVVNLWWSTNVLCRVKHNEVGSDQLHTLSVLQRRSRGKDIATCLLDRIIYGWKGHICLLPTLVTKLFDLLTSSPTLDTDVRIPLEAYEASDELLLTKKYYVDFEYDPSGPMHPDDAVPRRGDPINLDMPPHPAAGAGGPDYTAAFARLSAEFVALRDESRAFQEETRASFAALRASTDALRAQADEHQEETRGFMIQIRKFLCGSDTRRAQQ